MKQEFVRVSEEELERRLMLHAAALGADIPPKGGVKLDQGKPAMDLLPADALLEVAEVFAFGAKKYQAWNWSQGFSYGRLIGAILRHMFAFMSGEEKDPESGKSHLAHAGCTVLMLLALVKRGHGTDDRDPRLVGKTNES